MGVSVSVLYYKSLLLGSSGHQMLMVVALFAHILGYESEDKSSKGLGADDLAAVFFLSG